ncbi:MAG TPA: site-2 protease family protein [Methanolinea sp.]|jgi:membrane-associated protease RseP (regulator of RpoE activity)|nr:site-2 protease family protein [Methanolinea sp.]HOS81463.1 site-2 protease family protein [Methanolinea sp.]HPC56028.1 site-2 protease family protein [Methanolinea sp.]HQE85668.1 site-2 protease family protein [Methanolinea sp.]HQI14029.1 site-2 protease family protein [Methanolinea sp.]
MHWLFWVVLALLLYTVAAGYIYLRKAAYEREKADRIAFPEEGTREKSVWDSIVFYGPVLAIKTDRVGFFDRYIRYTPILRVYATLGVVMVALISAGIAAILFLSVRLTFLFRPEPTGIYAPQNIFLIPGINEYVPSTVAVWFAFVLTIAIHEWGHGILCRVENITVRSMGALVAVIPIGFFVEPDEQELEKSRGMPKIRMFGAGITNNIVVGTICFVALILLFGMVVPTGNPVIAGVYKNYSAWDAGVPAPSVITAVNGIPVASRDDVSRILNATRPGDQVTLTLDAGGEVRDYALVLSEWPEELGLHHSGFMGISYYDGAAIKEGVRESLSFPGLIRFLTIPFDPTAAGQALRVLAFETPETRFYEEPFPGFWGLVHVLFWCAWININVGIFNAIPMVPLDGGYILKEGVERLFERWGLSKYAIPVVSLVSSVMVVMLLALVLLPYLLHI